MTPSNKIRHKILTHIATYYDPADYEAEGEFAVDIKTVPTTDEELEARYDLLNDPDSPYRDALREIRDEFSSGDFKTNIEPASSRHYESRSVACKMADGSWVGWTYWYGGGKHGDPESIDWISAAYALDCVEEEKLVLVRKFTKRKG